MELYVKYVEAKVRYKLKCGLGVNVHAECTHCLWRLLKRRCRGPCTDIDKCPHPWFLSTACSKRLSGSGSR